MAARRNIRLVISYDGTDFGGWQRQINAPTIQGEVEKALARMHGRSIPLYGAGRTDSGVHARGQVANFYTDIASIEAGRFVPALNKFLPRSIRVLEASEAHFDFHARFDARLRRYRYFILPARRPDPFRLRYAHQVSRVPDLAQINAMASALIGETDFTALSSARDPSLSKRRTVLEASFRWESGLLVFEIAANAFMLRMVRSIVGSLLHWEAEGSAPAALHAALATGDRALAGPTAPSRGLFFWNAEYYDSPRKPGRGEYWSRRGYEEEAVGDLDGEGAGGAGVARPEEPGPLVPQATRPDRLVPGLGFVRS
ncbi:MAG: tRNA pseudouridine(38-40) synthase TruA [Spirochaetota bacterium]